MELVDTPEAVKILNRKGALLGDSLCGQYATHREKSKQDSAHDSPSHL